MSRDNDRAGPIRSRANNDARRALSTSGSSGPPREAGAGKGWPIEWARRQLVRATCFDKGPLEQILIGRRGHCVRRSRARRRARIWGPSEGCASSAEIDPAAASVAEEEGAQNKQAEACGRPGSSSSKAPADLAQVCDLSPALVASAPTDCARAKQEII